MTDMNTKEYFLSRCDAYCDAAGINRNALAFEALKKAWAVNGFFQNVEKLDKAELKTMLKVDQYMEDNPVGE